MKAIGKVLALFINRWKSVSPKRDRDITNISLIVFLAGTLFLQFFSPAGWVVSIVEALTYASLLISVERKFTTTDETLAEQTENVFKNNILFRAFKRFFRKKENKE